MKRAGFILLILIFSVPLTLLAQPGDPTGDPDVPITGIEILIALGSILGLRRFVSSKQRRS